MLTNPSNDNERFIDDNIAKDTSALLVLLFFFMKSSVSEVVFSKVDDTIRESENSYQHHEMLIVGPTKFVVHSRNLCMSKLTASALCTPLINAWKATRKTLRDLDLNGKPTGFSIQIYVIFLVRECLREPSLRLAKFRHHAIVLVPMLSWSMEPVLKPWNSPYASV
ncbi:hypothetical protein Tco_1475133 [Tanacetum coccineum]